METVSNQTVNVKVLYEARDFPVFQNRMYNTVDEAISCPKGDICLVENLETGLVYNDSFLPELMVYDKNYQNEQGLSPVFKQHLDAMVDIITNLMGTKDLVEVGCGKGFFLEMLLDKGVDINGFDPTYEGENERIKKQYFEEYLGIKAEGIILRHVLEHIQEPFEFLQSIKKANGGTGLIYIEVPCFDWICQKNAWFDIFYEHVNYFRLSDFYRMFGNVIESGRVFGGQYLYIVADLSSLKKPAIDNNDRVEFSLDIYSKIKDEIDSEIFAVWGGSSKGVIFSLFKSRFSKSDNIIIDINTAKHGKYLPATGLRVYSPKEGLSKLPNNSTIYIMNSNYFDEIKKMSNFSYKYESIDNDKL